MPIAGVAQSVEQLIRNEKVGCSIHLSGTTQIKKSPAVQKTAGLFLEQLLPAGLRAASIQLDAGLGDDGAPLA